MSDIYLSLTETPAVVTLSQPVAASQLASTVTVANTVTVALDANSLAALESVTVTVGNVTIGSSVSISNFPSTQTVAGTVTANLAQGLVSETDDVGSQAPRLVAGVFDANGMQFGDNKPFPISGTVTVGNSVTVAGTVTATIREGEDAIINDPVSGYTSVRAQSHWYSDSAGELKVTSENNPFPISGTVTVGNTVTIAGTVTANVNAAGLFSQAPDTFIADGGSGQINYGVQLGYFSVVDDAFTLVQDTQPLPISGTVTVGNSVTISGTVTANLSAERVGGASNEPTTLQCDTNGFLIASLYRSGGDAVNYDPVAGNVSVNVRQVSSVTIGSLPTLTPQLPRVTFIDGSGSVTTANSAITVFAASTTRSYLLVQVTTGSAFVNVGATATTLNGISLTAGQGYAWETTIPQGIVSLISTTTNSAYVAKQA